MSDSCERKKKKFPDYKNRRNLSFHQVFFILLCSFSFPYLLGSLKSIVFLRHNHKNIGSYFLEFIEMFASPIAQFASVLA